MEGIVGRGVKEIVGNGFKQFDSEEDAQKCIDSGEANRQWEHATGIVLKPRRKK